MTDIIPLEGTDDPRRHLASVAVLLVHPRAIGMIEEFSRRQVLESLQEALEFFRDGMGDRVAGGTEGKPAEAGIKTSEAMPMAPGQEAIIDKAEEILMRDEGERLRPVVNATGILLHTGLGRAVLPQRAVDALAGLNRCVNLQIDLDTGLRGKRMHMTERLLCKLTGAEAAMVVTNNAAATLLILTALGWGKEVIISRGQLIEIGGAFRLPDCIKQSGAMMVEVGTTNKTHLRDYEKAITPNTGILLRVNPSNYRVVGFMKEVPTRELVELKRSEPWSLTHPEMLVVDDLGCGALIDLSKYGSPKEPTVQESIEAGADIVCFSGDKLIGGPQAGIIVGRKNLIDKIKKHPLTRMLRVGKLTDMALEQTLRLFLKPETLMQENPTLRMLTVGVDELKARAERLRAKIEQCGTGAPAHVADDDKKLKVCVKASESEVGGGSLPATPLPTWVVTLEVAGMNAERLGRMLRKSTPPIIARIVNDKVTLDMRTMMEGDDEAVVMAMRKHLA